MRIAQKVIASMILLLLGCYTYVPAALETVPLNTEIKARVSTEGQIALRDRVGLDTRELQGKLLEKDANTILLEVPTTGPFSGTNGQQLYQRVDVPTRDVLEVEMRQPSPGRTAGLVVAALAAATGIVVAAVLVDTGPGSGGDGPPGPEDRIVRPLFTIPVLIR